MIYLILVSSPQGAHHLHLSQQMVWVCIPHNNRHQHTQDGVAAVAVGYFCWMVELSAKGLPLHPPLLLCSHCHCSSQRRAVTLPLSAVTAAPSPHLIYNRGLDDFPSEYTSVVELSGVGKEFFVLLKHIALHYHKLPHLLVFGRYSAFLHDSNCTTISVVMSSLRLSSENDGFAYVGEGCLDMRVQELSNAQEEIHKLLGSSHVPKHPKYIAGSLFAVTREAILRNPLSFYQDLARRVASEDYSLHGEVPILIDRLWPIIFKSRCATEGDFNCIYRTPA